MVDIDRPVHIDGEEASIREEGGERIRMRCRDKAQRNDGGDTVEIIGGGLHDQLFWFRRTVGARQFQRLVTELRRASA